MDRLHLIEFSLRCYRYGWVGLIPIFGLVRAIKAISLYLQARSLENEEWNPAHAHATIGLIMAIIGLALNGLVFSGVVGFLLMMFMRT